VALESDGSPNGCHLLSVDGNRYTTALVSAHKPQLSQLRIMLDSQLHRDAPEVMRDYHPGTLLSGPIEQRAAASSRIVVNFFDGGPRSKVEMAIGRASKFTPMQKTERTDPFVVVVFARNAETKKPWVKPGKSSHIWQATLPASLAAGTHRIAVRATDEYGREHLGWMVLEVTA
jgi:C terminal of Calcineurin-like phosphoesterase